MQIAQLNPRLGKGEKLTVQFQFAFWIFCGVFKNYALTLILDEKWACLVGELKLCSIVNYTAAYTEKFNDL